MASRLVRVEESAELAFVFFRRKWVQVLERLLVQDSVAEMVCVNVAIDVGSLAAELDLNRLSAEAYRVVPSLREGLNHWNASLGRNSCQRPAAL